MEGIPSQDEMEREVGDVLLPAVIEGLVNINVFADHGGKRAQRLLEVTESPETLTRFYRQRALDALTRLLECETGEPPPEGFKEEARKCFQQIIQDRIPPPIWESAQNRRREMQDLLTWKGYCEIARDTLERGVASFSDEWPDHIRPVGHFADSIRKTFTGTSSGLQEFMEQIPPEIVAAYDQLVDEFNADLERIKRERDIKAVNSFIDRVKQLIDRK